MPINQILAPYYLKVKYSTSVAQHNARFYFETGTTVAPGAVLTPGDWTVRGSASLVDTQISTIVSQIFNRAETLPIAVTNIDAIELWQAVPGVNLFLHSNTLPSDGPYGTGTGVASSYAMFVFGSPTRQKARMTFFEISTASPQRTALTTPPLVDNNTLAWYVLKGNVPFATQDGIRLTTANSLNTGYNRKLARSYGRRLAP